MTLSSDKGSENNNNRLQESKRDDIPPEYIGSVLRAEILPASEVSPDRPGVASFLGRLNLRYLALLIVLLVIIGTSSICAFGPGKPFLENNLQKLKNRYVQPTSTNTPTVTSISVDTPYIVSTSTSTPTKVITPIYTTEPPTLTPKATPTEDDNCIDAVGVTLEDVGSILCVRGTITGLEEREVGFIIYFSDERGVFYLVTYDLVWDDAEPGECIQISGEIQQLGNTPVMVFGWNNLPEFCP